MANSEMSTARGFGRGFELGATMVEHAICFLIPDACSHNTRKLPRSFRLTPSNRAALNPIQLQASGVATRPHLPASRRRATGRRRPCCARSGAASQPASARAPKRQFTAVTGVEQRMRMWGEEM
eukprot:365959-Chlamydomonas_euryale.AAC.2